MAPLIDPPGLPKADADAGNAMLYYGADTGTRWTHTDLLLNFNTWPLAPSGSAAVENIIGATLDSASKPIMLELFDYRAENLNYPVATPTLMNVMPWITAVHSATFVSPAVPKSAEGSSYVTLIVKTYPDYPQLRYYVDGADSGALYGRIAEYRLGSYMSGWTYRLPAGHTYRIVSDSAFIAYQSNFFGVALNGHVRHGDPGSYFFSCATPVVGRYPSFGSERPNATVSYNCDASWTIAASGSTTAPLGLATVLRDAHGDYMRLAQDSGFASSNIAGSGPLLTPNSLTTRFRVAVLDPLRNADAWIEVQNTLGNDTILHLQYTAPPLSQSVESISFDGAPVGLDSCVRITYRNTGTRGQDTVHMTRIVHTDSTFIVQTSAPLPLALAASDSVIVTVCHTGHVESRLDTLHVQLLCGEARVPIRSISAKTMMTANDYDFHGVVVGSTENKRIALMNTGPANLLLASVKRTGSTAFVFTDS
jgi:hypothetical protein